MEGGQWGKISRAVTVIAPAHLPHSEFKIFNSKLRLVVLFQFVSVKWVRDMLQAVGAKHKRTLNGGAGDPWSETGWSAEEYSPKTTDGRGHIPNILRGHLNPSQIPMGLSRSGER